MISSHSSTGFKRKATVIAVLFLLLVSALVAPATADYSESGISLHTVAHEKIHGAAGVSGGHGLAASPYSQSFSVPDGNVRFARLYVGVWGGTPENQGTLDTSINGASLGSRSLGGSSDSDGMTYVSGFGVHWAAYDVTGSVHPGSNSATATTGGDIDGRVYGIVLAVAVENQADPEIEYWFAEGCDNLNAAESKDYASVDFGSGPSPASVTDADLYVTYIASMSGDGDQLQLNGQTIATDAASGSSGSYFDMHKYSVKNLLGDSNSVSFSRGGATRLHPAFAGLVTTGGATPTTETPTPTETPTVTTTETTLTTETTIPISSTPTDEPTTQVPTTGPTETNTTIPTSTNTTAVPTGTTVTTTTASPTETTTGTTTTTQTQTATATPTTTQTVTTATTGVTTSATTVPVTHTATPSVTTTKNPEPTVSMPIVNTLFPVNAQTPAPTQVGTSSTQVQSPTSATGTVTAGATVVSATAGPTQQSQTIATQATAKATTQAPAQTTAPSTGSASPTSSTSSSSSSSNGAVSTGDSSSGSSSDDYTGVGGGVGTAATTARTTATATQTQSSALTPTPTPGNTSTPVMTTTTPPFLDTGSQNEYSPLTVPGSSSSKSSSSEKNSQKNILSTIQSTFDRLMSSDLSLLLLIGAVILFILLAFAGLIILVLFILLVLIAYLYLQQRNRLQKKD